MSEKRLMLSSILQFVFRRLKVSEAAAKMATSSAPAAKARCHPCTEAARTAHVTLNHHQHCCGSGLAMWQGCGCPRFADGRASWQMLMGGAGALPPELIPLPRRISSYLQWQRTFILGVRTGYLTPGSFVICCRTSVESASCGTHFGDTKLVASMTLRPACPNLSMSSTFTLVGICSMSRTAQFSSCWMVMCIAPQSVPA